MHAPRSCLGRENLSQLCCILNFCSFCLRFLHACHSYLGSNKRPWFLSFFGFSINDSHYLSFQLPWSAGLMSLNLEHVVPQRYRHARTLSRCDWLPLYPPSLQSCQTPWILSKAFVFARADPRFLSSTVVPCALVVAARSSFVYRGLLGLLHHTAMISFLLRVEHFFLVLVCVVVLRAAMFCSARASSLSCYAQLWLSLLCCSGAKANDGRMQYNSFRLSAPLQMSYTRL